MTSQLHHFVCKGSSQLVPWPLMMVIREHYHVNSPMFHLKAIEVALVPLKGACDDAALLEQYQEQMSNAKKELSSTYERLIAVDLPDDHALVTPHSALEKVHFDCSHLIRKLLTCSSHAAHFTRATDTASDKTFKLPKLDVPTFDANVLHWQSFWEQFETFIQGYAGISIEGFPILENRTTKQLLPEGTLQSSPSHSLSPCSYHYEHSPIERW